MLIYLQRCAATTWISRLGHSHIKSTRCDNFPEFDTQWSERFIEFEKCIARVANRSTAWFETTMFGWLALKSHQWTCPRTWKLMPSFTVSVLVLLSWKETKKNIFFVIRFKLIATNVHSIYEQWRRGEKNNQTNATSIPEQNPRFPLSSLLASTLCLIGMCKYLDSIARSQIIVKVHVFLSRLPISQCRENEYRPTNVASTVY